MSELKIEIATPDPNNPDRLIDFQLEKLAEPEEWMNIPWLFYRRVEEDPHQIVIERKISLGSYWQPVSAQRFADEIDSVARGFIGMGIEPGDRVAILGHTSYEWTLMDMALLSIGAVVVPIYETSSASQIGYVLRDADVKMLVVETQPIAELAGAVVRAENLPCKVISLATGGLMDIIDAGKDIASALVEDRREHLSLSTEATIIYTSGTTGRPKGVVIDHRQVVALTLNGLLYLPEVTNHKGVRLLLFLPLAHTYARFLQFFTLAGPGVLGHTPDIKNLLRDLDTFRPSYLLAVPRVMEKVYNSAEAKAGTGIKHRFFRNGVRTAIAYSRALDTPQGPSRRLKAQHKMYDGALYARLRALLGGAQYAISGGGPLGERLGHFYRGIGIHILEGYGLTETIGPMAVNSATRYKIGSVGEPVPPIRVRVSPEGELLVRGPSVFTRYNKNPEATKATFTEDGFMRTGDLGWIDADGYIHITGRQKELIITAGGKNVSPAILEDRLRSHPLISQVLVVGDRRPFISALVTLDSEMLPGWLANHGLPFMDAAEAARNPVVLKALDEAVERANRAVSRAESIRKISVINAAFTEENGLLTPSLKVKRKVALDRFKKEIDAIYGGPVDDDRNFTEAK